jgi:hypothetical protein
MRIAVRFAGACAALALFAVVASPRASDAAPEPPGAEDAEARARRFFLEGHEAADRGEHAIACARFEQSLLLFRRASTLLNLGQCSERLGRVATALRYWEDGAALLEPNDERMALAKERITELRERAPSVVVELPATLPAGAAVVVDGALQPRAKLGRPLVLDPGPHELRLQAPEREPAAERVTLAERDRRTVVLRLGPPIARPPVPVVEGGPGVQTVAGYTVGAVGIAALVAGGVMGALVLDRKATVEEHCQDDTCDDPAGVSAAADGRTLAVASSIAVSTGAAALVTGLVLLLTDGGAEEAARGARGVIRF